MTTETRAAAPTLAAAEPAFFPVGLAKLAIMSVGTWGLYEIYWSYKNWKCVSRLTGEKLNAPIRAIFYPLTSYFLFRRIEERGLHENIPFAMNAAALAFLVLILGAMSRLPDPYWLVSLLAFLPMLAVQSTVNEINEKVAPDADPNRRFSAGNIVWLVVGGLMLALVVAGFYLEPLPPP